MQHDSTLSEIVAAYIAGNVRLTSYHSGRRYKTTANNFDKWLGRPATLADLTRDNYVAWVKQRQQEVAGGTVRGEAEKLLVIWKWASAEVGLPMPMVKLPPMSETQPIAWTLEELQRLEESAARYPGKVGGIPGCVFMPALIAVAFDTGERIEAISQLEAVDINLRRLVVNFRRETRKGKRRGSSKVITAETGKRLRKLLALRPDRPFAPVQYPTLYRHLGLILAMAGLPIDRSRKFHCLRRTHATHLLLQGGNPTVSLDQASPETTWRHYIDKSQMPQQLVQRQAKTLAEKLAKPKSSWLSRRLGWTG